MMLYLTIFNHLKRQQITSAAYICDTCFAPPQFAKEFILNIFEN